MMKRGRNGRRRTMSGTMGLAAGSAADPKYAGQGSVGSYNPNLPAGPDPNNAAAPYVEPAPTRIEALGGATISSAMGGAITALLMFQVAKWMKKDLSKMGDLVTVTTVTTVGIGMISALFFGWRGFSIRVMDPRVPVAPPAQ